MKLSNNDIIKQIASYDDWVTATELSEHFDVSTRTIRSRIAEINADGEIIESSYKGYRCSKQSEVTEEQNEKDSRVLYVLRKLIVPEANLNIYDLADEMYISDSQFARVLDDVKDYIEPYGIDLIRYRNLISLERKEKNIRRLIMSLITNQENAFLISEEFDHLASKEYQEKIRGKIQEIFENCGIYANDYGFQTILMHVIIMLNRNPNESIIDDLNDLSVENNRFYLAATQIRSFIKAEYDVELSDFDTRSLTLMITNNCNEIEATALSLDGIDSYIEKEYIDLTNSILAKLQENYCLDDFDSKFVINLTLHIKNMVARARNDSFAVNPLAGKFKEQNALIYDMATFIVNEICKEEHITVVDDEIAFIAFHIGYYIEMSISEKSKVNCYYVYADYHMMYVTAVEKIMDHLHQKLNISTVIPIRNIDQIPGDIDLIISGAGPIRKDDIPVVETNIYISDTDLSNIEEAVDEIIQMKKNSKIIRSLKHFVNPSLFKRDFYAQDEFEMIRKLSEDCFNLHLVDSSFVQEVLERENLSSTSFSNNVAIPHSLRTNARQSFLYIVSNKEAMKWGSNDVNIIVLIGASKTDKKAFTDVFSGIINVLYEKENVRRLLHCPDYDSFIDVLYDLIMNYKD